MLKKNNNNKRLLTELPENEENSLNKYAYIPSPSFEKKLLKFIIFQKDII